MVDECVDQARAPALLLQYFVHNPSCVDVSASGDVAVPHFSGVLKASFVGHGYGHEKEEEPRDPRGLGGRVWLFRILVPKSQQYLSEELLGRQHGGSVA